MSLLADQREFEQMIAPTLTFEPKMGTGFVENFQAQVGQIFDEELSISSYINHGEQRERNQQIIALRRSGTIPDEAFRSFVGRRSRIDYDGVAQWSNENLGTAIPTNEELAENRRKTLDAKRNLANETFANQTGAGTTGMVAGMFTGYGLEPTNLLGVGLEATALRGIAAAAVSTSRIGRAAQVGGRVAGVNMAIEASLVQPMVYNWREEIGNDMTIADALINIVSVGAVSGGISFAGKYVFDSGVDMLAKLTGKELAETLREQNAVHIQKSKENGTKIDEEAIELNEQMATEAEMVGDKNVREHLEAQEAMEEAFNNKATQEAMEEVDSFDDAATQASYEKYMADEYGAKSFDETEFEVGVDGAPIEKMAKTDKTKLADDGLPGDIDNTNGIYTFDNAGNKLSVRRIMHDAKKFEKEFGGCLDGY